MATWKKWAAAVLAAGVIALPCALPAAAEQGPFGDVDARSPYAGYISTLKLLQVAEGDGNGNFVPEGKVTRAEFAKMMVEGFGLRMDRGHFHFFDMDSHWAAGYVQTAWNHGLIEGTGEYVFSPDRSLTREEAAAIMWRQMSSRGLSAAVADTGSRKEAEKGSSWAKESVEQCMTHKLFGPAFASGTFRDPLTRQEAAALLVSSLRTLEEQGLGHIPAGTEPYVHESSGFALELPKVWKGRFDAVERKTEGVRHIEFRCKAAGDGVLFQVTLWPEEDWKDSREDTLANTHAWELGTRNGFVYVFIRPSDVQYNPENPHEEEEYRSMSRDVEAIRDSLLLQP